MDVWKNITPNFGPFAPVLEHPVGVLLALVWAAGFIYVAIHLATSIARMAKAKRANVPDVYEEAKSEIAWPAGAAIGLAMLPVIWGVLVTF